MKKVALVPGLLLLTFFFSLAVRSAGEAVVLAEPPQEAWRIYLPFTAKPSPIANHNFEQGTFGWQQSSLNGFDLIVNSGYDAFGVVPRSGSWLAWLGSDYDEESVIQQQVTIPANAPYLTYWYWIDSIDPCGFGFGGVMINDQFILKDNLEEQHNLCEDEQSTEWTQRLINLSAFAGQTVVLKLYARTGEAGFSHLFIDDLAFTAAP